MFASSQPKKKTIHSICKACSSHSTVLRCPSDVATARRSRNRSSCTRPSQRGSLLHELPSPCDDLDPPHFPPLSCKLIHHGRIHHHCAILLGNEIGVCLLLL